MGIQALPASADAGWVLAKATVRASTWLGLSDAALARTIGVSKPTVSRIVHGKIPLNPSNTKTWEFALLLVRVFRSLDALVGGNDAHRLNWMRSYNRALNGKPCELIQTTQGLLDVLRYLDGMRAPA